MTMSSSSSQSEVEDAKERAAQGAATARAAGAIATRAADASTVPAALWVARARRARRAKGEPRRSMVERGRGVRGGAGRLVDALFLAHGAARNRSMERERD